MKRATNLATTSGPARSRGSVVALVRLAVATVAVILFSLVIYRPAYALSTNPGVEINGWSLTAFGMDGEEGYLVYAPDKFSAAAMALGYSWDDVQGFTADQKAYMSNESTGGDFYVFASNFEELSNDTPSIGDVPYAWAMGYLRANQVIWGGRVYTDAYAVNTTRDMYSDAKQKIQSILDGDVPDEEPQEPTIDGDYVYFPLTQYCTNPAPVFEVQQARISLSTYNAMQQYKQEHSGYTYVILARNSPGNYWNKQFGVMCVPVGSFVLYGEEGTPNGGRKYCGQWQQEFVGQQAYIWQASSTGNVFTQIDGVGTVYYNGQMNLHTETIRYVPDGIVPVHSYFIGDGPTPDTPSTPVVPPTHWPDPPENPTVDPPTVPEPPSGPTVEPPTIPPQPTPTYPTPPVVVEPTVPATPDLSDILDALNEHCIHLQDAMHREAENIDTDMRAQIGWLAGAISDTVESLDGDIELYFKHLEDYLYDLFHWLADQFDFTFGEYDDSSVIHWLRMIYSKLGRGGPTTKPTDPVTDPFGIGEWLKQLIDNFLLDLIAIGAGDLADVIADFRDLATKFPFSVPWDLAAMLALLVAEPVTPVIDFPWYSYTASGLVSTTVHMDLSAWNATMEPIRLMEKLAFCMLLASRSKDLLDFIRLGRGDA